MTITGFWKFLEQRDERGLSGAKDHSRPKWGGTAMHRYLRNKVVVFDASLYERVEWELSKSWGPRADGYMYTTRDRECHVLKRIYEKIQAYMLRGGCRFVLGVLDSQLAKDSKRVRGNRRQHGGKCRRNLQGLNKTIIALFKAMGCRCIYAPDSLGEGEAFCAQLQRLLGADRCAIDSPDGDCFLYGGTETMRGWDVSKSVRIAVSKKDIACSIVTLGDDPALNRHSLAACEVYGCGGDLAAGTKGVGILTAFREFQTWRANRNAGGGGGGRGGGHALGGGGAATTDRDREEARAFLQHKYGAQNPNIRAAFDQACIDLSDAEFLEALGFPAAERRSFNAAPGLGLGGVGAGPPNSKAAEDKVWQWLSWGELDVPPICKALGDKRWRAGADGEHGGWEYDSSRDAQVWSWGRQSGGANLPVCKGGKEIRKDLRGLLIEKALRPVSQGGCALDGSSAPKEMGLPFVAAGEHAAGAGAGGAKPGVHPIAANCKICTEDGEKWRYKVQLQDCCSCKAQSCSCQVIRVRQDLLHCSLLAPVARGEAPGAPAGAGSASASSGAVSGDYNDYEKDEEDDPDMALEKFQKIQAFFANEISGWSATKPAAWDDVITKAGGTAGGPSAGGSAAGAGFGVAGGALPVPRQPAKKIEELIPALKGLNFASCTHVDVRNGTSLFTGTNVRFAGVDQTQKKREGVALSGNRHKAKSADTNPPAAHTSFFVHTETYDNLHDKRNPTRDNDIKGNMKYMQARKYQRQNAASKGHPLPFFISYEEEYAAARDEGKIPRELREHLRALADGDAPASGSESAPASASGRRPARPPTQQTPAAVPRTEDSADTLRRLLRSRTGSQSGNAAASSSHALFPSAQAVVSGARGGNPSGNRPPRAAASYLSAAATVLGSDRPKAAASAADLRQARLNVYEQSDPVGGASSSASDARRAPSGSAPTTRAPSSSSASGSSSGFGSGRSRLLAQFDEAQQAPRPAVRGVSPAEEDSVSAVGVEDMSEDEQMRRAIEASMKTNEQEERAAKRRRVAQAEDWCGGGGGRPGGGGGSGGGGGYRVQASGGGGLAADFTPDMDEDEMLRLALQLSAQETGTQGR